MSMQSNLGLLVEVLVYHFKNRIFFLSYYLFLGLLILFSTSLLYLALFEYFIVCFPFAMIRDAVVVVDSVLY